MHPLEPHSAFILIRIFYNCNKLFLSSRQNSDFLKILLIFFFYWIWNLDIFSIHILKSPFWTFLLTFLLFVHVLFSLTISHTAYVCVLQMLFSVTNPQRPWCLFYQMRLTIFLLFVGQLTMCKQYICTRHCVSVNVYITAFTAFYICTANLAIIERKRGERELIFFLYLSCSHIFYLSVSFDYLFMPLPLL